MAGAQNPNTGLLQKHIGAPTRTMALTLKAHLALAGEQHTPRVVQPRSQVVCSRCGSAWPCLDALRRASERRGGGSVGHVV